MVSGISLIKRFTFYAPGLKDRGLLFLSCLVVDLFSTLSFSITYEPCDFDFYLNANNRFVCSALRFIPHEPKQQTLIPYIFTLFPTNTLSKIRIVMGT